MSIHEQIRARREAKGWSQSDLAERVSTAEGLPKPLTYQTIQQWENGSSAPKRKRLTIVAKVFECSVTDLLALQNDNVTSIRVRRSVPLVTWVRAGLWGDVTNPFQASEADEWIDVYDISLLSDISFALRVEGDSMVSPHLGEGPNFPPGTIIVVDPDAEPAAGDFVIAKDPASGKATFKKLVTDGGRWFLRPLNPTFPTVEIDDPKNRVIGKVVELVTRRKL